MPPEPHLILNQLTAMYGDSAVQWMRDVIRQAVRRMKIERAA